MMWAVRAIGPHLNVNMENVASCVRGDPCRDFKPIFPQRVLPEPQLARQLDLWFNATWKYYGGQGDMPYNLLEEDTKSKTFALTDPRRYPRSCSTIQSPYVMNSEHLMAWRAHITLGENGQLAPETDFIFIQPRPGKYEHTSRDSIHPDAESIRYPAESLLYARWIDWVQADRRDLPEFHTATVYRSLSKAQERRILRSGEKLGVSLEKITHLFVALANFDAVGPYQADVPVWTTRKAALPLLPEQDPRPTDGVDYLNVVDLIFLPPQFYNPGDVSTAQKWALYRLLLWCDPSNWMHAQSNTLVGGPYGIKWPILVLIVLLVNMRWARHVESLRPAWLPIAWTANEGQRGEHEDLEGAAGVSSDFTRAEWFSLDRGFQSE
ncbi:hypothetical protein FRC08_018223 [Ceratobasidium sp. 394]|nr:hypothetical protein FRC08_018223 [Ceratobasidium sp. 394]